jgi:geranylgeranylglycerol-phosphate geranylgeranyltransferase
VNLTDLRHRYLHTKTWGTLEFIRIFNMTMPFTSGLIGVVMGAGGISMNRAAIAGMFIPVFLWAGGQVFNDIFDLEVDRINTPYRAVPSRRFSIQEAVLLGGGLTLTGVVLSILTRSYLCQMLTILAVLLSNIYSCGLKRRGFLGHLNFAFCVLLCIYIGQSAVSEKIVAVSAPIGIFFYHIAINIMASVGDVPGDKKTNVITLPVQVGPRQATILATILWIGGVAWSAYWSRQTLQWMVIIVVILSLSTYNSVLLLHDPTPQNATTTLRLFRCGTILLQLSLVIQSLSPEHLFFLTAGLGSFTVVTFLLFEVPKGIHNPVQGVVSHG